jgi:hypothetical protein
MNSHMNIKTAKIEQLLNDDWQERAAEERRSDSDNRNGHDKIYFEKGGSERRKIVERRHPEERRDGWLRIGQWRSESVFDHKS